MPRTDDVVRPLRTHPTDAEKHAAHTEMHTHRKEFRDRTQPYTVRIDGDIEQLEKALLAHGREFEISIPHPVFWDRGNEPA